jgi:sugar (pentulose or hexulose) kinase
LSGDFVLGLDIGTSVIKAALFDRHGRETVSSAQRTTLFSPQPGWSEADMTATWHKAAATIRELLATSGIAAEHIAAVGLAGNMIGAWIIDADGQPVRNGILWNDGRSQALLDRMEVENPGVRSYIFGFSGSLIEYGCTLPVLAWLAEHEPESMRRARYVLRSKDWIRFQLTGQIHTDVSEVPGLPGDVRRRDYSPELMRLFGLEAYQDRFPPHVASEAIVGEVLPHAAEVTGLRAGTPVAAGLGDVPAVALGVGAVETGVACSILGTHCINGIVLDQPSFEPKDMGLLFTIPGGRWMRALTNAAGTTNLDWAVRQFVINDPTRASGEAFAQVEAMASRSPVGARGVLYHPYLSASGIISPILEPAARAQFFGLQPEHRREDLLRAVYEGVAFAICDCYAATGANLNEVRLSGGGARSSLWAQIIADVLGVRIIVPKGSEFGAKGAALAAGVGVGWYPSIVEAARTMLDIHRTYEPDAANKPVYDENYALYTALRDALRPFWQYAIHRRVNNP